MTLPLHTHASIEGVRQVELLKVLDADEAAASSLSASDILIVTDDPAGPVLARRGASPISVSALRDIRVVQPGDVVRLRPGSGQVSVVFRRGVASNVLFATERCNSRCVMCSQPPRDVDDAWRVGELLRLIELVDVDTPQLTISGGEPTLLGDGLANVLQALRDRLPATSVQVLTNGRILADRALAQRLARLHPKSVTWAVPLYADVAAIHDDVVAAEGAFDQTLQGLYELGCLGARIEVRVVLHALTIPRLEALASFIYRRLPFVAHVALMGLEPMGFARGNRERLWIDPADYQAELAGAAFHLALRGLPVSIYNLPLCVLDRSLWPLARQSISGWKNDFPADCTGCAVQDHCAGFFASAGPTWRSRRHRPFALQEFAA